jgi:flagellar protein FlaG
MTENVTSITVNKPDSPKTVELPGVRQSKAAPHPPGTLASLPAIAVADVKEQVAETVELFNRMAENRDLSVEFSVEETLNRQVVKIIDKETGDVVAQLPSEAALNAAKNLDVLRGVFLDDLA